MNTETVSNDQVINQTENLQALSLHDLADSIRRKADEISYYKNERKIQGKSFRDTLTGLKRENDRMHLEILERRIADPALGIEVTLVRYPDEEYTEVSQNKVTFSFPISEPHINDIQSDLDFIASAKKNSNSMEIVLMLGDYVVEDEGILQYLKRTHWEIRSSERRFSKASKKEDIKEMDKYNSLRKILVKRLLLDIRAEDPNLVGVSELVEDDYHKVVLSVSPSDYTKIDLDEEIISWIEQSGDITWIGDKTGKP